MSTDQTRDRLLDAAQHLFVKNGIDATSLRAITTHAKANLASVNYHFGSKNELIQAVFARHIAPMNEERIRLLDAYESNAKGQPLELEDILTAFLKPSFEMMRNEKSREFICLLGRMFIEHEDLKLSIMNQFKEIQQRFFSALQQTLPDLSFEDLAWRVHFLIGAMAHTFAVPEKITMLTDGRVYHADHGQDVMQHLITFSAAGLRVPNTIQRGEIP